MLVGQDEVTEGGYIRLHTHKGEGVGLRCTILSRYQNGNDIVHKANLYDLDLCFLDDRDSRDGSLHTDFYLVVETLGIIVSQRFAGEVNHV